MPSINKGYVKQQGEERYGEEGRQGKKSLLAWTVGVVT
jgi:hypothetical protein